MSWIIITNADVARNHYFIVFVVRYKTDSLDTVHDRIPGMKKLKKQDNLRKEYKRLDFTQPMVRGKYANKLKKSSNVVVLRPEVAKAFPNEEAVNNALTRLIEVARETPSNYE